MDYDRAKNIPICLFLFLLIPPFLFSQVLIQKNLTVEDGLVYSQVLCAYQDQQGYMWFGTSSGLSRWDGQRFQNFHSTENIRFDNVKLITELSPPELIIVTRRSILTYRDGQFYMAADIPVKLTSWIEQAVKLNDGLIYLAAQDSCLWQYDGQTFIEISPHNTVRDLKILSLQLTGDNKLLIGSQRNGVLYRNLRRHLEPYYRAISQPGPVTWLHRNKGDTLYIGTRGAGLYYSGGPSDLPLKSIHGIPGQTINHMHEAASGLLYVATDEGVAVLSGTKIIRILTTKNGLANDFVWYISEDRQKNLYFCMDGGGVSPYRPDVYETYDRKSGLPDNTVWCIRETAEGKFYFATDQGIAILENGRFSTLTTKQGLSDNMIITIHQAKNGRMFFGTSDKGVDVFENGRIRKYNSANGLTSNFVWSITEDDHGKIYLATYDGGICVLENDRITDTLNTEDGLTNDYVVSSFRESSGIIYFGLDNGGVAVVEHGQVKTEEKLLPGYTVWAIHRKSSGQLLLGTDKKGLIIRSSDTVQDTITMKDGLSNNCILGIMEDRAGRIYLTTDNGVNVLDFSGGKLQIRLITNEDGLASRECNQGAYFKDSMGRLWIGTIRGVTCYNPAADEPVYSAPAVHITGLRVFDREINIESDRIVRPFEYHENYLQFKFIGLDLRAPHKVKYRYRLKSTAEEWIDTDYPEVQLANLKDDDYRFEVQARNEWDLWSAPSGLNFSILPPFWATWWFRMLIILLASSVIASLIYFRIRQLLAVERIRAKIAADLHDDIGAGLSEINILTAVTEAKMPAEVREQTRTELSRIAKTASQLIDSMSDIVWLVNPKKDSMTDLVVRLKDIFNDLLDAKGIAFKHENMHLLTKIKLKMEQRQFIFLIFKEALNNVIKYSQCTTVSFAVLSEKKRLKIILKDDGIGFDIKNHRDGNGLKNMVQRAQKIKGELQIESNPGKGTIIRFNGRI